MDSCLEKIITRGDKTIRFRFWNQDCVEGMASRLDAGCADVVVTSPPYNIGVKYRSYDDTASRREYLEWTRKWLEEVKRILAAEGSFFLNVGGMPSDPWVPFEVLSVAREFFALQNVIHWAKSIAIDRDDMGNYPGRSGDLVVGHYKPVQSLRYLNDCHEYIFHLTSNGDTPLDRTAIGVPYQDKSNVKRWKAAGKDRHCRGNVWFIPYETIQSRNKERPHPATFPVRLPSMCVLLHGLERTRLVVDPFLGLGSTAVACAKLDIPFVGFEIDEEYISLAFERLKESTGDSPLFNM
ncbi:MAG TPA: site-specific DNA-methyltransferase [Candidatus Brocadiia bacterium]|nr:site-specific DNA-methyltransferase [Candidatus Brocadiia bacterium]